LNRFNSARFLLVQFSLKGFHLQKEITMGKTMCEKGKKGEKDTKDPQFRCKRCGALVKKEKQVCKPKEI